MVIILDSPIISYYYPYLPIYLPLILLYHKRDYIQCRVKRFVWSRCPRCPQRSWGQPFLGRRLPTGCPQGNPKFFAYTRGLTSLLKHLHPNDQDLVDVNYYNKYLSLSKNIYITIKTARMKIQVKIPAEPLPLWKVRDFLLPTLCWLNM